MRYIITKLNKLQKSCLGWLFWFLLMIFFVGHTVHATELTIKTVIDGSSCQTDIKKTPLILGDDGKLNPQPLLGKDWYFLGETPLVIALKCKTSGLNNAGDPTLKIIPKDGTVEIGNNEGLFAETNSGFGVVVGNHVDTNLSKTALVTLKNPFIELDDKNGLKGEYRLPVAIACGSRTDCTPEKLHAGKVKAAFIISLEYR